MGMGSPRIIQNPNSIDDFRLSGMTKKSQNPRGSSRTLILALAGNTNQNQLLLKIEEKTYKNGTQLFDSDKKLKEKLSKNGTQLLNRSDREFKILDNFPKKIQTSRNNVLGY